MKSSKIFAMKALSISIIFVLSGIIKTCSPVCADKVPLNSSYDGNIENNMITDGGGVKEVLSSHGASRFDVGGILGMKQGASIFALVLFPILFPLMVLLGVALFIISLSGGLATVVGRRSDIISNSNGVTSGYASLLPGYKLGRDGLSPISLTNRDELALGAVENEACLEKFVCEVLLHYGGSKIIGKKTTFEILRELNVKPFILPNSFAARKSRKIWKCSTLNCKWNNWIPWTREKLMNGG